MPRRFSRVFLAPAAMLALIVLLAGGCSVAPKQMPDADSAELWQQRAPQLEALADWTFSGRAALSGAEVPSRTVRIRWRQTNDAFDIAFQSPIGQRVAELGGDGNGIELRLPGEPPVVAGDSRELLTTALGWSAPVESLRYWVLGLPDPDALGKPELDAWGRLARLWQDGWLVEYGQYAAVGALELPRRLTVTHPDLRIRLVIDRWELETGNGRF